MGQEVTSLVQKLLKTPGGRPVALPCTPRTAEEEADREAGAGTFDPRNDPSLLVLQCEETALGCRKLLELWASCARASRNHADAGVPRSASALSGSSAFIRWMLI